MLSFTFVKRTEMGRNKQEGLSMEQAMGTLKEPLKEVFARIDKTIVQREDIWKEAKEIKKGIANTPKKEEQQIFAFIPHEMAKVSIFFPMSDRELKEDRRLIHKLPPIESNWGRVEIEGVKLAIFEEDVFLMLIKIGKDKIKSIKGQYILETSLPEVAKILYGNAGYTKRAYNLIKRSLDHFELTRFQLTLFNKGSKKEVGRIISIGGIISRYDHDEKTHKLRIYFNPHFFAYFLESMLTGIDFTVRRKLKKAGSKALIRFLATHRNPGRMHILTVLKAINYNIDQPMYELRRKAKQFIAELKKNKVLGAKTKIYLDDTVFFDVLPPKKVIPE